MNCTEFREVVDSYLSDELLTETNHSMMKHVEACGDCQSLVEARKEIRSRLKFAVQNADEYRLPEGFDHKLMTRLRTEAHQEVKGTSWFGLGALATSFGAIALIAVFGFVFLGSGDEVTEPYLVKGFSSESLLNVAAGDHEYCAIKHQLEELPVALSEAAPRYRGLDKVVEQEVGSVLAGHRLSESHSCKYKDTKFAHIVMRKDDKAVSVLVASNKGELHKDIVDFESEQYRVSAFSAGKENIYVISNHDKETNRKTAEAMNATMVERFAGPSRIQTALLTKTPLALSSAFVPVRR